MDEIQSEETQDKATQITVEQQDADTRGAPQSIDELATEMGWRPKDQWKGNEEDWRDAAEYIRHGQHGLLVKKLAALEDSHKRLARTATETTKRMLEEQEAELTARFEQAVEDGDKAAAAKASRQLDAIERKKNEPDPLVADFAKRNEWYQTDPDATDYAASIANRLANQGRSVEEQLDEAEKAVRKRFPELFEAAPRRKAPEVAAPATRSSNPAKREKSAADLPRDIRAVGEDFVRMATAKGRKYTIEDYARTYFAETGQAA